MIPIDNRTLVVPGSTLFGSHCTLSLAQIWDLHP